MRKLITTIALLALADTSVAMAQTRTGSRNPGAPPSTNSGQQLLPDPHRSATASRTPIKCLRERPDGSEGSHQPRERGARPHDQRYLPRLLSSSSP